MKWKDSNSNQRFIHRFNSQYHSQASWEPFNCASLAISPKCCCKIRILQQVKNCPLISLSSNTIYTLVSAFGTRSTSRLSKHFMVQSLPTFKRAFESGSMLLVPGLAMTLMAIGPFLTFDVHETSSNFCQRVKMLALKKKYVKFFPW